MMGQHDRSESLFYYFRLEDQVPENHLLRLIDKHVSFAFVRETLKQSSVSSLMALLPSRRVENSPFITPSFHPRTCAPL